MIKVYVLVSGLLLVQPDPAKQQIDVHFPQTTVSTDVHFTLPLATDANGEETTVLGKHLLKGRVFNGSVPAAPFQRWLRVVGVDAAARPNLEASPSFPNLTALIGRAASRVRPECAYAGSSLTTCKAAALKINADGSTVRVVDQPLLRAQLRLQGNWTLRAVSTTEEGSLQPLQRPDPPHGFMSLAHHPSYSMRHTGEPHTFASGFLFEAVVAEPAKLEMSSDNATFTALGAGDLVTEKGVCERLDPAFPKCAILRLNNGCPDCDHSATGWGPADVHFGQLYRLLASYGEVGGEPSYLREMFVPVGETEVLHAPGAGSGVRCYGGIVSP